MIEIGMGINANSTAGDAETSKITRSFQFGLNYNLDPFKTITGEVNIGTLAGGDINSRSKRFFTNSFKSIALRAEIYGGSFFGNARYGAAKTLKSAYVSSGLGIISNSMSNIGRIEPFPGLSNGGLNNSRNIFVPVKLGYEFKIKNGFDEDIAKFNIGYQYNFVLGDDIDGYSVGLYKDTFSQFSVGLKIGVSPKKIY